ncbi:MAG: PIN domain-containing protein [Nanoarchaeota archaeon]|nr:PIN domain-containing protein [Nanoarchaeota archaeon]
MEEINYFFDTYAIIEILNQNPSYEKYKDKIATITIFNLSEIYYYCLNNLNSFGAEEIYNKYREAVVKVSDSIIKNAMMFRKNNKKKDLSYADCIGYIYASKNNIKFLTGDKEFKNMKNVEFVK